MDFSDLSSITYPIQQCIFRYYKNVNLFYTNKVNLLYYKECLTEYIIPDIINKLTNAKNTMQNPVPINYISYHPPICKNFYPVTNNIIQHLINAQLDKIKIILKTIDITILNMPAITFFTFITKNKIKVNEYKIIKSSIDISTIPKLIFN